MLAARTTYALLFLRLHAPRPAAPRRAAPRRAPVCVALPLSVRSRAASSCARAAAPQREYGVEVVSISCESVDVYSKYDAKHKARTTQNIEDIVQLAGHVHLSRKRTFLPLEVSGEDSVGDVVMPTVKYFFRAEADQSSTQDVFY